MGQQQLILLVLATIIVGLAIVVGIRAFTENSVKSNSDALMQDAVRIANDAQAWKQKPGPFGGQEQFTGQAVANDVDDFTGAFFPRLGYNATAGDATGIYTNLNGDFRLTPAATNLLIEGVSLKFGNEIQVTVTGLADSTIAGNVLCLGFASTADGSACTPAADGS